MVERQGEKSRLSGHFCPQLAFFDSALTISALNWHLLRENEKRDYGGEEFDRNGVSFAKSFRKCAQVSFGQEYPAQARGGESLGPDGREMGIVA